MGTPPLPPLRLRDHGAAAQLQMYHGTGSNDEVAGAAIGFSVNLPPDAE
jgi:hypothetical protein